ncbi:unnamed protein product, partial [Rotaria sp. Silwood2]
MATIAASNDDFKIKADDQCLEIFCLIWLNANPSAKDNRDTEQKLRSIINQFKRFHDVVQCKQFVEGRPKTDRLVMIVSGQLGREIVPSIHKLRQVISIYVYCQDKAGHEKWACKFWKVKAVVDKFEELISQIKADHKIQKVVEEPLSINTFTTGKSTGGVNDNIHMIFLFREYISDIQRQLKHHQAKKTLRVYRGQMISSDELKTLEKCRGQFISISSFFSTSTDEKQARGFLNASNAAENVEPVLFEIIADPEVAAKKPFADISHRPNGDGQVWIIQMNLCSEHEHELKNVLIHMKNKLYSGETTLRTLGSVLWEMGKFNLAEKYLIRFLDTISPDDSLLASLYEDLAKLASHAGDYDKSVQWHQKGLALQSQKTLSTVYEINKSNNSTEGIHHAFVMDEKQPHRTSAGGSLFSSIVDKSKDLSSSLPTSSESSIVPVVTTTSETTVRPRRARQNLSSFVLIWLDATFNEFEDYFKNSLQHLRQIVPSITTFTDAEECITFISEIKGEKVYLIVSGSLGQHIIPKIHAWSQLESVYIFCSNKSVHERWAEEWPKVKSVYTQIKPICEALQADYENCDQVMVSISFSDIEPTFMYTQLLTEALLEIEDDDQKSIKDFVHYCRQQDNIDEAEISKIEREYLNHSTIWWYTAPYFMYSMIARGLRLMDIDIISKMGFFIRHLHMHIKRLYHEQQSKIKIKAPFQVFRGQGLSIEHFQEMKQRLGRLMSFNNFLSTSLDRNIMLEQYSKIAALHNPNIVGILFVMKIDPALCAQSFIPFAHVKEEGYYKDMEKEILFSTHTIFRIDRIERIPDKQTDRLYQVYLTLTNNRDHELSGLTEHLRQDLDNTTGWSRFARILIKLGEFRTAEYLYQILLPEASSHKDCVDYNLQLGTIYNNMGEYSKALSMHERSLEIRKKALPPNHPDLATSYNNIGMVYDNMGEYSKAFSMHERSLEIREKALPPNHPDLATSYNNIGMVYDNMGEYSKALSMHERSLEIRKKALPPNHPDLATSYNNIGMV